MNAHPFLNVSLIFLRQIDNDFKWPSYNLKIER